MAATSSSRSRAFPTRTALKSTTYRTIENENEVLIKPDSTFKVMSIQEATPDAPKIVRLRYGSDGTPADCMWCQLEREFNVASLVTEDSRMTDFGTALASRAPGRPPGSAIGRSSTGIASTASTRTGSFFTVRKH